MKHNNGYKNTAFWIGLILLLSMLSTILFAEVDSDMPMYEKGANYERNRIEAVYVQTLQVGELEALRLKNV